MNGTIIKRNGYIDIVKFLFAVIVTEFHLTTGIFPGGRVAVEGFFFISGYFMMQSIRKNKFPADPLGVSTVKFLRDKFKSLFPFLLPAALVAFGIDNYIYNRTITDSLKRLPLLFFDIVPLGETGFQGVYLVGISWYLGAMFVSLAILYPFCKKFGSNFILTACPIICLLIYGMLSHFYGHLAINFNYLDGMFISSGLLRGFAGCTAGCLLSEICNAISKRRVNIKGRILFSVFEIIGIVLLFLNIHYNGKSKYEYLSVFIVFALLIIGIGGLSFSSVIFRGKWTKFFGVASTLLVLCHYRINVLFRHIYGAEYIRTNKLLLCFGVIVAVCFGVWLCGWLITKIMKKTAKLKIWKE